MFQQDRNPKQKNHIPRSLKKLFFTLALNEAGTTYSDLTGRYLIISSRGNEYIFIYYDYKTNSIYTVPTKTCIASEIWDTIMSMLNTLTTSGNQFNIYILDNEASSSLKLGLLNNNIKYQLVPVHTHRKNADERAIKTF